jgi:O-antigen/teichoic acid export membrane protein
LVANSVWVSLAAGAGAGVAAALIVTHWNLFPHTPDRDVWLTAALVPPSLFFLLGVNLLVGLGEIRVFNVFEAASAFTLLLFLGGAAVLGLQVAGFLATSAIAWWLIACVLLIVLQRRSERTWRLSSSAFRSGLRYATKAYVVALLGFLVLRSNFFLLARLAAPNQIGYFSVAAQLADVLALVPTAAAIVIFPRLVKEQTGSWKRTVGTAKAVAAGLAVLCLLTAVVAGPLVRWAFGSSFEPAVATVRWMLPGVLALGIATVFSQYVAALGIPRRLIVIWAVALAAMVGLGRGLIPHHGDTGAAAAYSSVYCLVLVLVFALAYSLRDRAAGPAPIVETGLP